MSNFNVTYDTYNLNYGIIDSTNVSVTGFSSPPTNWNLTIPINVTYLGIVYNVISIGTNAFNGSTDLTSVTISNLITSIDTNAFNDCSVLTSVYFLGAIPTINPGNFTANTSDTAYYYSYITNLQNLQNFFTTVTSVSSNFTDNYVTYTFLNNINVYISGFSSPPTPWNLLIPNTVTHLGSVYNVTMINSYAFENCSTLASLIIPNSITTLNNYAVRFCNSLTSVTIGSGLSAMNPNIFVFSECPLVTTLSINSTNPYIYGGYFFNGIGNQIQNLTIGDNVIGSFEGWGAVTSVSIGVGITSIGPHGNGLTTITIPSNVTSILDYAFDGHTNLTSIINSSGVKSIGNVAFSNCTNLVGYDIPPLVTSIGYNAFQFCSSLTNITIPAGVLIINNSVFYNDTSLNSVTIGKNVTSIGIGAFQNCSSITSIIIHPIVNFIGNVCFQGCSNIKTVIIPDSVTFLGNLCFGGLLTLTSVTIGSGISVLIPYLTVFYECPLLTTLSVNSNIIYNNPYYYFFGLLDQIQNLTIGDNVSGSFTGWGAVTSVSIGVGITSIGPHGNGFTSFTIPSQITSILDNAFDDHTNLTSIINSSGVKSIGTQAFKNCTNLVGYDIPPLVTSIGYEAFQGCTSLKKITIPDSISIINNNVFLYDTGLTSVTIGQNVTSIGIGAFQNCSSITSIIIPPIVRFIGNSCFKNLEQLQSITIPDSVTTISDSAFVNCLSLTSVIMGSGFITPQAQGYFAIFQNCPLLTYINFNSNDILNFYNSVFSQIYSVQNIIIGNNVITSVPFNVFGGYPNLVNVTIGNGVTNISDYACQLCPKLITATIGSGVTSIGSFSFYNCLLLKSVYFFGNIPTIQGNGINNNFILIGDTAYFNGDALNTTRLNGFFTYLKTLFTLNYLLYATINETDISIIGTSNPPSNWNLTIPAQVTNLGTIYNVKSIGSNAFSYITSLSSIIIPSSITSISVASFNGCYNLKNVEFYGNIPTIDPSSNNFIVTGDTVYYTLDASNVSILTNYFTYFIGHIVVDNVVYTTIDSSNITVTGNSNPPSNWNLIIPATLTVLGITYNVISISNNAFNASLNLTSISIPSSVTSIGLNSFKSCLYLANVYFLGDIPTIDPSSNFTRTQDTAYYYINALNTDRLNPPLFNNKSVNYDFILDNVLYNIIDASNVFITGNSNPPSNWNLIIPSQVTNLRSVYNVIGINENAFNNCVNLTSATIPDSIASINIGAFNNCPNLLSVYFLGNIPIVYSNNFTSSIDTAYYYADALNQSMIYNLFYNKIITLTQDNVEYITIDNNNIVVIGNVNPPSNWNLIIPSSVTISGYVYNVIRINNNAFNGSSTLTSVSIPASVTSISSGGFNCPNLLSVYFYGNIPDISSNNFTFDEDTAYYYPNVLNTNRLGTFFFNSVINPVFTSNNVVYTIDGSNVSITSNYNPPSDWILSINQTVTNFGLVYNVKSINTNAFINSSTLKHLTISASITSIGLNSFSNCLNLLEVQFLGNIPIIESGNFGATGDTAYCYTTALNIDRLNSLFTNIIQSNPNFTVDFIVYTTIDTDKVSVTSYSNTPSNWILTIPLIVTNIGIIYNVININESAFSESVNLINVTIPNLLIDIGINAFKNCNNLTTVLLPDTITNISSGTFQGCDSLRRIIIPSSTLKIDPFAFDCINLENVYFLGNIPDIKSNNFTKTIDTAYYYGTPSNTGILSTFFSQNALIEPTFIFENIVYKIMDIYTSTVSVTNYSNAPSNWNLTIPSTVTNSSILYDVISIEANTFQNLDKLQSVIIPNSVTSIGIYAFSGCNNLSNISVNSYIYNFSNGIFGLNNENLIITFDYIGSIPEEACFNNSKMKNVVIGNNITSIDSNAFEGCFSLTYVTIPNSVTNIGSNAFSNCNGLTNIIIPSSVTNMGQKVFNECNNLINIIIYSYIPNLGNGLFGLNNIDLNIDFSYNGAIPDGSCYGKTNLKSVTLCNVIQNIGQSSFEDCSSLTSVIIPVSVTTIGKNSFSKCNSLTSIIIPSSVINIGATVFTGCLNLLSITVDSVNSNYSNDIYGVLFDKLKTTILCCPGGFIGSYSIPVSVTSCGDKIFNGCFGLTNITINSNILNLSNGLLFLNNENLQINFNYNGSIPDGCCYSKNSLSSIIIGNSITNIGQKSFNECSSLTSVIIPVSVTGIGKNAFSNCSSLESVTFLTVTINSISENTFSNCSKLKSIIIPDSVTSIGQSSFNSCSSLTNITIDNSVKIINDYAFQSCTSLTTITIPNSVTSINENVFQYCSNLTSINILS